MSSLIAFSLDISLSTSWFSRIFIFCSCLARSSLSTWFVEFAFYLSYNIECAYWSCAWRKFIFSSWVSMFFFKLLMMVAKFLISSSFPCNDRFILSSSFESSFFRAIMALLSTNCTYNSLSFFPYPILSLSKIEILFSNSAFAYFRFRACILSLFFSWLSCSLTFSFKLKTSAFLSASSKFLTSTCLVNWTTSWIFSCISLCLVYSWIRCVFSLSIKEQFLFYSASLSKASNSSFSLINAVILSLSIC